MIRIDHYLVLHGYVDSRNIAQRALKEGKVLVDGVVVNKPSYRLSANEKVRVLTPDLLYVSRSAMKLKEALTTFRISVHDLVCCDLGAGTGGFTQVLLENGAQKVYAVDVGSGQLHAKLKNDPRIQAMEKMNARDIDHRDFDQPIQFLCADLSFISLSLIIPSINRILVGQGCGVVLIKPQFELSPKEVPRGIVTNQKLHRKAINRIENALHDSHLQTIGWIPSSVKGSHGNQEFLMHFKKP